MLNSAAHPAGDRHGPAVAERLVFRAIGCGLAAVVDVEVVVGETLQARALSGCEPANLHCRQNVSLVPAAAACAQRVLHLVA
jgi:hypothetical protein